MAGYIGNKSSIVSSGAERKFKFTITETTTTLSNLAYTRDLVHVFHNGVRLVDGTDYTATNGTSITLTNAAENGDEVVVISYASFQPSDTVSASTGGVFEGNITVNGDLTVDADTLFVDAATNEVGIGTTTAARSARLTVKAGNSTLGSGYSQLSVITSDAQAADVGGSIVLGGQSTAADWVYGSVSGRSENNSYAGYLAFGTSTSLGAHAERMRIDSSGNVGIGTSSPQKTFVISDNGAIGIEFSPDDAGQGYSRILNYDRNASAYEPLYVEAEDLRFSTGASATERMRITSSGNVGIGTSSPSAKLDVVGANDTTFDGVGTIRLSGTNAYNSGDAGSGITFAGIFDSSNGETTFAQISGKKANTTDGNYDGVLTFGVRNTLEGVNIERMRIDSSGNVGIGTTSPNALLAVNGGPVDYTSSASGTGLFHVSGGASSIYTAYIGVADDGVRFGHNGSSRDLIFDTNETERMRIDSAGRVTMPYQPAFYASVDYDNGGTVTNYGYTWLNRGSHFNATTGLFTAPVSGVYYFAATIMGANSASAVWWRFVVNGILTGSYNHSHADSSEPYRTVSAAGAFQLSANDTVGIYLGLNTAYSSGPNPWSSFSGFLIG